MKSTIAQFVIQFLQSPQVRVAAMTLASGMVWFCWGYWANREYPDQALISGFSQGGINLLTTAFGSTALEILFVRIGHTRLGRGLCVFLVSFVSLCAMLTVHIVAGTPNLLLTVLPVYGVVVLYCSSYIYGLTKIKNEYENQEVAMS